MDKQYIAAYAGVEIPLEAGATQEDALNAVLAYWPDMRDGHTCTVDTSNPEKHVFNFSKVGGTKG